MRLHKFIHIGHQFDSCFAMSVLSRQVGAKTLQDIDYATLLLVNSCKFCVFPLLDGSDSMVLTHARLVCAALTRCLIGGTARESLSVSS